jgi:hypothetical protein
MPCSPPAGKEVPTMLKNALYNLMETVTVISKGLHRYDAFMKDAGDCQQCKDVWTQMKKADEEQLHRLVPHLKQHLDREEGAKKAA